MGYDLKMLREYIYDIETTTGNARKVTEGPGLSSGQETQVITASQGSSSESASQGHLDGRISVFYRSLGYEEL